jgi:hypothetical protein
MGSRFAPESVVTKGLGTENPAVGRPHQHRPKRVLVEFERQRPFTPAHLIVPLFSFRCDDNWDDLFIHQIHECSRLLWCHAAEHFKFTVNDLRCDTVS